MTDNGVKILGYTDLPGQAAHAGVAVVRHEPREPAQTDDAGEGRAVRARPRRPGDPRHDGDCADGETLWPPPAISVSAAPVQAAAPAARARAAQGADERRARSSGLIGVAAAAFLGLSAVSPEPFLGHFMVFALAVVIGFYVIGNVHHALHTPLMSVTNAISGIILVGALLQVGHGDLWVSVLAFIAILVASINVFGGFTVTARMLQMFRREDA
ncbi:MAG: proton-translocating transhydrogenase family protein [Candidatus Nanopelagicales bacterium]